MTKIIGLAGPKGCGKSTVARAMKARCENAGTPTRIISFAAPLKHMMGALYEAAGLDADDINEKLNGKLKETYCPIVKHTPRHAMQTLGTEWGREMMSPTLWTRVAMHSAEYMIKQHGAKVIIFDDVRFETEVRAIDDAEGVIVGIERMGFKPSSTHKSENGVDASLVATNYEKQVDDVALDVMLQVHHWFENE